MITYVSDVQTMYVIFLTRWKKKKFIKLNSKFKWQDKKKKFNFKTKMKKKKKKVEHSTVWKFFLTQRDVDENDYGYLEDSNILKQIEF